MRNYQVRVLKKMMVQLGAVVSVDAASEEEAIERATEFARSGDVEWTEDLSVRPMTVGYDHDKVETIVDLDNPE